MPLPPVWSIWPPPVRVTATESNPLTPEAFHAACDRLENPRMPPIPHEVSVRIGEEAAAICGTEQIDHPQLNDAQYARAAEQYEEVLGKLYDNYRFPLHMLTTSSNVTYVAPQPEMKPYRPLQWYAGMSINQEMVQQQQEQWQLQNTAIQCYNVSINFGEMPCTKQLATPRELMVYKNRARSARLKEKFAKVRALKLLLEHLTEDQREEYETEQAFHVETADGRRRYLIKLGTVGNIKLVKSDGFVTGKLGEAIREGDTFCWHVCHPDGTIPAEDNVLAQKLMLECPEGEQEFLAAANVS